ncbi:MAG TPA: guanylate kinase, partial [Chroococcales cyanobacterium]
MTTPIMKGKRTGSRTGEMPSRQPLGTLIVVTGPSGVGKGTVVQKVIDKVPDLRKSVSVTTRSRRSGETEGADYFFRSAEEFDQMIENSLFMEYAEFAGNLYGTPKEWVLDQLETSTDVILEIEVQGAKQIKKSFPEAVMIFLSPPSFDALKSRLKGRATESPAEMILRLTKARTEMRERTEFHYEVVNDDIDDAVNNLTHIV